MYFGVLCFGFFSGCREESKELAVIETDFGRMVVRFYDEAAPMHVESFKILAKEGYFDGTTFHRVIPGFVIQGGDPNSKDDDRMNDGEGGRAGRFYDFGDEDDPDTWRLPAEFNSRHHVRGALSMARTRDPNSAGSQFFICVEPAFRLDGQYTVFGQVTEGLDVIDKIVEVDTPRKLDPDYKDRDADNPLKPVRMKIHLGSQQK
ncbi:MAG: peptidylprolyl isomerase [Fidelibacterota bacterium]